MLFIAAPLTTGKNWAQHKCPDLTTGFAKYKVK